MARATRRICIGGGQVWTGLDDRGPVPGGVLVEGDRIAAILAPGEVEAAAAGADAVLYVRGALIAPPLYDGHVHSSSTLLRGTENSLPLELWSYYAIKYGRGFSERCARAAIMLTAAEMIRNGIAGYVDHYPQVGFLQAAFEAHARTGMRVGFAPFFQDVTDHDFLGIPLSPDVLADLAPRVTRSPDDVRASFADLAAEAGRGDAARISLLLGPNGPQRCSPVMIALWHALQDELGLGAHTHLLETLPQAAASRAAWPGGLVGEMNRQGLLTPKLSVAHGIWLEPGDHQLLARRGVTLVHNPTSNRMLGSGQLDIRACLDAGLKLALGTDCSNTGGRHDLFEAMRFAVMSGRAPGSDHETWLKPVEAFRAATAGGAGALGVEQVQGLLAPGAAADLMVLNFRREPLTAAPISIDSLVMHADARSVSALMVGGEWLMRHGRIECFDEDEALDEAAACAGELRALAADKSDLAGLHAPYGAWQRRVFDGACGCPACGAIGAGGFKAD
ncbi:MAG: amidohydrolase family protein [Rhizobiales bacterium]|nr:amidohydrolase family protein [Hyphomicrobiales bacterium]